MTPYLLSIICEPVTKNKLHLKNAVYDELGNITTGELLSDGGNAYPIINGIPRFVAPENYSADFGSQWNTFPKTQLDSATGLDLTRNRLQRCLRGDLFTLTGKSVLEAGSGAGRFTEILLNYAHIVHSFD